MPLGVVPPDRVGDLPVISWITRPNTAPRSSSSSRALVCQVLLGHLVREQRRHPSLGDHHGDRSDAPNSEHPDYWIRRIEFERGNCPHRRPAGGRPRPTAFSTRFIQKRQTTCRVTKARQHPGGNSDDHGAHRPIPTATEGFGGATSPPIKIREQTVGVGRVWTNA